MEPRGLSLTLGSPKLVSILVFESGDEEHADGTIELITRDYAPKSIQRDEESIKITLKDTLCTVELTKEKDCIVFLIGINHLHDDYVSKNWQEDLEYYRRQVQPVLDTLPQNPILLLSVFVGSVSSLNEAINLLKQYSEYVGYHKPSAGITDNCLLATFRKAGNEASTQLPSPELLLSPVNLTFPQAKHSLSELLAGIKHLAINLGKLDKLRHLCQPFFPQIDPAEADMQEKIEGIMNRIRQTEPVEIETLKLWLSEVMVRFSSLSVLSGSIKRDQIAAETYMEENRNLLSQWSETSVEGYPTNMTMETMEYNSVLKPFKDFVGRTEALRTQLETVSDMIRTYLGIGQQEQSSEILKQQVTMLHTIENHERLLKRLTWVVAVFTITLVTLEVLRALQVI